MKDETRVNHPPEIELPADNQPLNLPVFQNVKWETDSIEEGLRLLRGERAGFFYSRVSNPTVRQLELLLAGLQGREDCLASASGVNAVAQTLFGLTEARDHVIFFVEGYGPTRQIIRKMLTRFGITHSMLSIDDLEGLENELAARRTKLVFFESPTNPVNKIADIASITRLAQTHGALTVLDNTAAGFHQHGEFPVDFFVHSLTKFTTGAGDVMGGAVIADRARLDLLRADYRLFGAQLDPLSASLMVRGMKTYFVRYRAQSAAALEIARFLEQHPGCVRVRYPGLESSPKHALARQQMRDFGTVICFDLKAGYEGGRRFAEALQLFARTPSFGSTESLVMPPQMMQPKDFSAEQLRAAEIGEGTVRLSIGLENVEDLKADLARALQIAAAGPGA
ncbi:MAG: trans-sulfuration enzyme family protein [Gammaproteobacteria bacterium]